MEREKKAELFVPASLRHAVPRPRHGRPAASDVASFERDLVEALRPRLVVVLGVGVGETFCALCQAVRDHRVDCLLYGVDPFSDDDAKPADDDTRWESLNNFLHTHYRGSSYLLKSPPADTLRHFGSGSVDLLCIDAPRLGAPLAELISAWAETVSPGGVLVSAAEAPELPEAWSRAVKIAGATLRFASRRAPGARRPEESPLLRALGSEDPLSRESVASFYEHVHLHHTLREEIDEHRVDLHRKKAGA